MTNSQGLYFCLAVTMIVAAAIVYLVVKRNKDKDYNQDTGERAVRYSSIAMLAYPLFIVLGIMITLFILFFHSS